MSQNRKETVVLDDPLGSVTRGGPDPTTINVQDRPKASYANTHENIMFDGGCAKTMFCLTVVWTTPGVGGPRRAQSHENQYVPGLWQRTW